MEERFIGYFTGEYHFLSNFAYVPHGVFGYKYNENWYQAAKFPKGSTRRDVIKGLKPGQAKRYAKQNEHEHRADWKEISLQVKPIWKRATTGMTPSGVAVMAPAARHTTTASVTTSWARCSCGSGRN
jgi:hypothetical protein